MNPYKVWQYSLAFPSQQSVSGYWASAMMGEYETLDEALGHGLGTAHGIIRGPNDELVAQRDRVPLSGNGWGFGWTGEDIPFSADDFLYPAHDEGDAVL